ncbi:hypothetical protein GGR43_001681 [Sphingobium jiangsuense]|uniref:Uncharacterized protein n=1 Tax=Sphingobium jiangsuense TaxID=870476 RepID=A0A7W6BFE2_9SPHN|nr:hypothetical protein [Sphingobium jiangsuense]MBB3925966.1 hypothetical protein [Sphingobium jiangsuense]
MSALFVHLIILLGIILIGIERGPDGDQRALELPEDIGFAPLVAAAT